METGDCVVQKTVVQGQKRHIEDAENSESPQVPRKVPKLKDVPVNINGKNPVALLNELRPGLSYQVSEKYFFLHQCHTNVRLSLVYEKI